MNIELLKQLLATAMLLIGTAQDPRLTPESREAAIKSALPIVQYVSTALLSQSTPQENTTTTPEVVLPQVVYVPVIPTSTPSAPVLGSSAPEVVKELRFYGSGQDNKGTEPIKSCKIAFGGYLFCSIEVMYLENGKRADASAIALSTNDGSYFITGTSGCTGGEAANTDGTQRKGTSVTCPTGKSGRDGLPVVDLQYFPFGEEVTTLTSPMIKDVITATYSGVTARAQVFIPRTQ